VRLTERQARRTQQFAQIAFRYRRQAKQQILPHGFGDGGGLLRCQILAQLLLDGFTGGGLIGGGHGGTFRRRYHARRYRSKTRGRRSRRAAPRSRERSVRPDSARRGWKPVRGWR